MSNTITSLSQYRLCTQQIAVQQFAAPAELVAWMGFIQAQDYPGAKWSIGLRVPGATDASIEQAIADKSIVRSWSFRGTLHFMSSADIRWMLQIAVPRVMPKFSTHLRKLEMDKATLSKSRAIFATVLRDGKHLTRKELMVALQKKKISTDGLRSNFFILNAALEGLICCGVRRSKEFTYTLLDQWLPATPKLHKEEALAALALRYFNSHGPATSQDFAWWLGITQADAKAALAAVVNKLQTITVNDQTYYLPSITLSRSSASVYLLPGFDEYLLGYKNREAVLAPEYAKHVVGAGNGLFAATIVVNGGISGTWKRTLKKDAVVLDLNYFTPLNNSQIKTIKTAANKYSSFIGLPLITQVNHKS
jgi:hypothetical protein